MWPTINISLKYFLLLFLIIIIFTPVVFAQQTARSFIIGNDMKINYYEHLPDDYNSTTDLYPVIIFLHGSGEVGNGDPSQLIKVAANGPPKQIKNDVFPKSITLNGKTFKFIVISPQLNTQYSGVYWNVNYIASVFSYVKRNYRVDPSRIYLTGLSLGGGGVWDYASSNPKIADSLAAIAPVCGASTGDAYRAGVIAKSKLPVWAFHGESDGTVPIKQSVDWVNQINSAADSALAKLTRYPNVGHNSWDHAYDLNYNQDNGYAQENLYTWLLQHQRKNLISTIPEPSKHVVTADEEVKPYSSDFFYGSNMGYYTSNRTDIDIAQLVSNIGGHTLRPALPHSFLKQYGYSVLLNTFKAYKENLDMHDLTVFVEGPADPVRDKNKYEGSSVESKVFKNLYKPIWNSDSSINMDNYYADYIYQTAKIYGPYVKFWEVWNEPDFTTVKADIDQWLNRAPKADELDNLHAPFYYYVRMLRITYEVLKKFSPEAHVATGGIGYPNFLDALLRYTDNPDGGKVTAEYPSKGGAYFDVLSFHSYPNYSLRAWDNSIGNFRYFRNSDNAADEVMSEKAEYEQILLNKGYDGNTHPKKIFIMTETGVARKTFDYRYGSDEMQRNFVMKTLVQSQKKDIRQVYFYQLGEKANVADDTNYDEFKLMGFYENLLSDQPGSEKLTQAGVAHQTTSSLLYGFKYDSLKTKNLISSNSVDGAAFIKNNEVRYILWAKTNTDESEVAQVNYTFPPSLQLQKLFRYEWDYTKSNKTIEIDSGSTIALTGTPSIFIAVDLSNPIPPVVVPPVVVPPDSIPPVVVPPDSIPPVVVPPDSVPPVVVPPDSIPPVVVPPDSLPPVVVPPDSIPPVVMPPDSVPPVVVPPDSIPPVVVPPDSVPPVEVPTEPTPPSEVPADPFPTEQECFIFPNPSRGKTTLRIKSHQFGPGIYVMYTMNGQKIASGTFNKDNEILDVAIASNDYVNGIYLIKVTLNGKVEKILKMIKSGDEP